MIADYEEAAQAQEHLADLAVTEEQRLAHLANAETYRWMKGWEMRQHQVSLANHNTREAWSFTSRTFVAQGQHERKMRLVR